MGRLIAAQTASSATAHVGLGTNWGTDGPYAQGYTYDVWGNQLSRQGWGGEGTPYSSTFNARNQREGYSYDPAGNITSDGWTTYRYDATGQQFSAEYAGYSLEQSYDGDRQRVKRVEQGEVTYYLRSSVLGGQVVCEMNGQGSWTRGYVYHSGEVLAIQQGGVLYSHSDPLVKNKRIADATGGIVSVVELDPFGGATSRMFSATHARRPPLRRLQSGSNQKGRTPGAGLY